MRIVLHGQQAFGEAVLQNLLDRGEDVVAVCCAPTKEGKPEDPLALLAKDKGIPLHQPASWKTPEALELMQSFKADICMMAYVLLFVPEAVRDAPTYGTFQYHPSLCPLHRGPSSINWPIAMGKTHTGLTIFWPDDGLDEGPIMLQKTCAIGADETLGDIYFKKLFPMGVDAMLEALDMVKAGVMIKHDQRLEDGTYEGWFKKDSAKLDWAKPVAETYNTIRAANPAPGAWTTLDGAEVKIYDAARMDGDGTPGEIIDISEEGVTVQGNGGRILIKRVRPEASGKIPASEWASAITLKIGNTLGS
ncbi:MAG: methionyl-tRNA formyltransferase [Alphaproteobacteria bacterium]|jgi:methionyl-tRNA formyltransferase|nr:methionyl-tRNA formyltransferase [Alphaproteobacteria bacterium]